MQVNSSQNGAIVSVTKNQEITSTKNGVTTTTIEPVTKAITGPIHGVLAGVATSLAVEVDTKIDAIKTLNNDMKDKAWTTDKVNELNMLGYQVKYASSANQAVTKLLGTVQQVIQTN